MMAAAPASSLGPTSMHWRTHVLHALHQQNEEEVEPFRGIIQSCKCLHPRIALLPLPLRARRPLTEGFRAFTSKCIYRCHKYDCI